MSDERFRKSAGEGRETRAMKDRAVTQNREISDDERVAMFRQQFFSVLSTGLAFDPWLAHLLAYDHQSA